MRGHRSVLARSARDDAPTRDVAIVTPWFPTRQMPFRGAFVAAMVEATAPVCDRLTVYHCDEWPAQLRPAEAEAVARAHRELLPRAATAVPTVGLAALRHLPVPLPLGLTYADIAIQHETMLRAALRGGPIDAPVVHAHVGLPAGWAALACARRDARVFVTEHATYLNLILEQPQSRAMYDELLHRCTGFYAVGQRVRAPLAEAFPHHADRIELVPNAIDFEGPARPAPVTELRRWLFLGGLIPQKGVDILLDAFAVCYADDPEITLTIVGEGPLRTALIEHAAELGIAGAVTFAGPAEPPEALRLMREHDVLVHPSRFETFGMTVVEAIAAGTPVLVTRCGGPEETLAGIADAAGELVDVEDGPDSLVAGYRRLRARFPHGLDLAGAAKVLADRYSYQTVARAYSRIWFRDAHPSAPIAEQVPAAHL